jgi:hypothetical protein
LQLLSAHRVDRVGQAAWLLVLRAWDEPVRTYSVGIARTSRLVTSTVGRTLGLETSGVSESAQSLADAVAMLCPVTGNRVCAGQPRTVAVPPPPTGEPPGSLAVVDLPPVSRVARPWVATAAAPVGLGAPSNPAATPCDGADFFAGGARQARSRTYVVPQAVLPDRFGLAETYGRFPSARAAVRFLAGVRTRVASCEQRTLVSRARNARTVRLQEAGSERSTWDVETEVSSSQSVLFRLGFVRVRDAVAQVTFAPVPGRDISAEQFSALLARAGSRLRELPRVPAS